MKKHIILSSFIFICALLLVYTFLMDNTKECPCLAKDSNAIVETQHIGIEQDSLEASTAEPEKIDTKQDTLETFPAESILSYSNKEEGHPLLSFRKLDMKDEMEWIKPLQAVKVPNKSKEGFEINDSLNVYIKYVPDVEGYTVACRLIPYGTDAETGFMIMNFQNSKTSFMLEIDIICTFHLVEMTMGLNIEWKDGDVYEFNYIDPSFPTSYNKNKNSLLGYYTPFQILDIDFDGEKEFIISDYYRGQGGNNYDVYKILNNKLVPIHEELPFSMLDNMSVIDTLNKSIIINVYSALAACKVCFTRHPKTEFHVTSLPQFHTRRDLSYLFSKLDDYVTKPQKFSITFIKEIEEDSIFEYRKYNKAIKLVFFKSRETQKSQ